MNWIKKIIRPLLLFGLPLVVIACTVSYKFNGSSINYDKVKTISIADFPIKSEYVYAPLATKFNEDLKDIFIRQTRLQLLKPNQNHRIQSVQPGSICRRLLFGDEVDYYRQCTFCQQHQSCRRL